MAYESVEVLIIENFLEDRTQDASVWKWYSGSLVVANEVGVVGPEEAAGRFVGDAYLPQRMTIKFSKSDLVDQWIYAYVRMRDSESGYQAIAGYASPDSLSIYADEWVADSSVVIPYVLDQWYWLRCTIDGTRNVVVEIFDADPTDGASPLDTLSSNLPGVSSGLLNVPGIGGLRAAPGLTIDSVTYEVPVVIAEPDDEYDEYYYVGTSILVTTKKMLGLSIEDHSFDHDVITHINSAFNTLQQLGIGSTGFAIEDDTLEWSDFAQPFPQFNMVKSFVYSYARLFFDPPTTTFHLNAAQEQLKELTWRLSVAREDTDWVDPVSPIIDPENDVVIFDGGGAA